jgi:pyridinium-3,5-bisthiocarboxylic acid mononucleotide nickel chelatase
MACLYVDCFAGVAGDMLFGALLDAGAKLDAIRPALDRLNLGPVEITAEPVRRKSLGGTKVHIDPGDAQPMRHLPDIEAAIDAAELSETVTDAAKRIFRRLARAEAAVHRCDVNEVHFHEVGAVDSVIDIVGICLALETLGVTRVTCSPLPLGWGTVECEHGTMPVPAPATAELLRGLATCPGPVAGELTTPTAAAVLTELSESFGPPPEMRIDAIGYGAGTRESEHVANLTRVLLGQAGEDDATADAVMQLSATIDDCTGEVLGATIERLLSAGCLDAWASPAVMKRARPGWVLTALCPPAAVEAAEAIFFRETTTFGLRCQPCQRSKLARRIETVETSAGPIRVKVGTYRGQVVTRSPEFADCAAAAASHGRAVRDVMAEAIRLADAIN